VEWVGGHTPTAYFKDASGNTVEEVVLQDFDHGQMLDFFTLHGLTPTKPKAVYGEPTITWDFSGHHYEFFPSLGTFADAKQFALSRTYNGLNGYPLTLSTPEEEAAAVIHLKVENEKREIWLGTQDLEEGIWKWIAGPEDGTEYWQGKGTQGSATTGQYNHWREHEPNNADDTSEEDCAALVIHQNEAAWNDISCYSRISLVVEYGDESLPFQENENPKGSTITQVTEPGSIAHEDL